MPEITELPEKYVLVGPEDHNELPTFWNMGRDAWGEFEHATRFDARILTAPLPPKTQYLIDAEQYIVLTPIPMEGEGFDAKMRIFRRS